MTSDISSNIHSLALSVSGSGLQKSKVLQLIWCVGLRALQKIVPWTTNVPSSL